MPADLSTRFSAACVVMLCAALLVAPGCATHGPWPSLRDSQIDLAAIEEGLNERATLPTDERLALLTGDSADETGTVALAAVKSPKQRPITTSSTTASPTTARPNNTTAGSSSSYQTVAYAPRQENEVENQNDDNLIVRAQSPDDSNSFAPPAPGSSDGSEVQRVASQYPELSTQGQTVPSFGTPSPNIGAPNEQNPLLPYQTNATTFPQNYADLDVIVAETQTGKINFGGAYNSDNGIVGQFTIDEKNFDWRRFPKSFGEILDGTAWRGGGQTFRLELVPGANLERYLVSFAQPHLRGTDISFSASGYLFQRQYFDYDESRLGGRFALGRRLTPDLSVSAGLRLESVEIDNPRVTTSDELNDALGRGNLFLGNIGLIRDTRNHPFIATAGSYFALTYSQAFGDYSYSRGDVDYRRYRLLYERPDGSGKHTLSFGTKAGFSGSSTPIFENYYAGGFSTMRGFDFRGASPLQDGVRVGGEFQWLNSLEYMFPLTADDSIRGVLFCDFGTVEENIEISADNFRVAPGFGFRVNMPALGVGAPLAFDFGFPVASAPGDEEKIFSFYLGVLR
jgi:outer membrane protein insertion porin family